MKQNKEQTAKEYLRDKKMVVGLPIIVRFKRKMGGFMEVKAKKGTEVVKYRDVLKALSLKEQEVKDYWCKALNNCGLENQELKEEIDNLERIRGLISKDTKEQAKQDLWNDICKLNEDSETNETLFITLDKTEITDLKNKHLLK